MTNAEYFEKNNVSFSESMKLFNKSNFYSFDEFLKVEHIEQKFKIGDIVVLQLNKETRQLGWDHNVVFKIIDIQGRTYRVKYLTPTSLQPIDYCHYFPMDFIDDNCEIY